jgi:enoyl-CoA hydratase/carnithine racemase
MAELDSHLDAIERTPNLRGLILASAKPGIFIAGADIHAMAARAERAAPLATGREGWAGAGECE